MPPAGSCWVRAPRPWRGARRAQTHRLHLPCQAPGKALVVSEGLKSRNPADAPRLVEVTPKRGRGAVPALLGRGPPRLPVTRVGSAADFPMLVVRLPNGFKPQCTLAPLAPLPGPRGGVSCLLGRAKPSQGSDVSAAGPADVPRPGQPLLPWPDPLLGSVPACQSLGAVPLSWGGRGRLHPPSRYCPSSPQRWPQTAASAAGRQQLCRQTLAAASSLTPSVVCRRSSPAPAWTISSSTPTPLTKSSETSAWAPRQWVSQGVRGRVGCGDPGSLS